MRTRSSLPMLMPDSGLQKLVGFLVPPSDAPRQALPLDIVKVSAGFPSPAADYEEKCLDINGYLVRNPVSTFFFAVPGKSPGSACIWSVCADTMPMAGKTRWRASSRTAPGACLPTGIRAPSAFR